MGLKKYRSVQEMPPVPFRKPLDPDNLRIACALSETALALHPRVLVSGVTKFRSASDRPTDAPRVQTTRS